MKQKNKDLRLKSRVSGWESIKETAQKDKKGGLIKIVNGSAFKKPGSYAK